MNPLDAACVMKLHHAAPGSKHDSVVCNPRDGFENLRLVIGLTDREDDGGGLTPEARQGRLLTFEP